MFVTLVPRDGALCYFDGSFWSLVLVSHSVLTRSDVFRPPPPLQSLFSKSDGAGGGGDPMLQDQATHDAADVCIGGCAGGCIGGCIAASITGCFSCFGG